MYMPGRLRTASSPSKIVMESAPYSFGFFFWEATIGRHSLGLRAGSPMTLRCVLTLDKAVSRVVTALSEAPGGSPVGVARAPSGDVQRPLSPRRRDWAGDSQAVHHAIADLRGDLGQYLVLDDS